MEEVDESLKKNVVQRLINLIKFRNNHPALDGQFNSIESGRDKVHLNWEKEGTFCELKVDLITNKSIILFSDDNGTENEYFI